MLSFVPFALSVSIFCLNLSIAGNALILGSCLYYKLGNVYYDTTYNMTVIWVCIYYFDYFDTKSKLHRNTKYFKPKVFCQLNIFIILIIIGMMEIAFFKYMWDFRGKYLFQGT